MQVGFSRGFALAAMASALAALTGCPWLLDLNQAQQKPYVWTSVVDIPGAALTSVHGTAKTNVFAVGADDGTGPIVIHWNGEEWSRLNTGRRGDLWWVYAIDDVAFMCGANANVIRYEGGAFSRLHTPGLGNCVVYGIWGSSKSDIYAVGAVAGRNGFIWHFDGSTWTELALPDLPQDEHRDIPQFLKVWGTSASDVWVCGQRGVILRGNARDGFETVQTPSESFLFTVHGVPGQVVAVGAESDGVLLELGKSVASTTVEGSQLLQGVCVTEDGDVWATGAQARIFRQTDSGVQQQETGLDLGIESLHAVWVDDAGGVWSVGGNVLGAALDKGVLVYGHPTGGVPSPLHIEDPAQVVNNNCPADKIDTNPGASIARRWNEQLLNAIRRDIPRPTVHARNLFHVSAAMWDVWSAYDPVAVGYLVNENRNAADPQAEMKEAISYAALRILTHRYAKAVGGVVSVSCFESFMQSLGYDSSITTTDGDSPAAFGNRVAAAYITQFANDGSNEQNNYNDPFVPSTPHLTVDTPGSNTNDPTIWQRLILAQAVTQNGIPQGSGLQGYIGAQWGAVTPFALVRPAAGQPYFDIQGPTTLNEDLISATVEAIRKSAELDATDGVMMDASPGGYGNNPLGTNDGTGHPVNPVTGLPYEPQIVPRGDFTRLLAEFWADGPASETPPGHWNSVANDVADSPGFERKLFGAGPSLDPLAWDVHVYFALNGAVHDAAIVAWELKRNFLTARPITLIRTLGARGQSSDPSGPSYHPEGLPLVNGLIEVITEESAATGQRHAHLSRYVGEIAVRGWRGEPGDRINEVAGVGWIRAVEWSAYQRRTFVTPAFPGFTSGHSTFSRSAAEVLTELTGSAYFPGGIGGYTLEPGWLTFEKGPSTTVRLEWGTYYDAADQAGQSRLWGGIHVRHDDFGGRITGSTIGKNAVALATAYFDGSAAAP